MSEDTVATVQVKEKETGRIRVINQSSFDKELHEEVKGKNKPTSEAKKEDAEEFDREKAKEYLTEKNVSFAKNISNEKLAELVEETKKKEPAGAALSVKEVDGKFRIVDADDNQQGDDFDTKEDAELMLSMLTKQG